MHTFSGPVEHAIAHIEEAAVHSMPEEQQRWYAIKIFERDDKVLAKLSIPTETMNHIEEDIKAAETELDDDAESIITNERYIYIAQLIKGCYKKKSSEKLSTSDKIDKVVTNRWLGLPIFAVVMFLVYYIAMVAVGAPATDWANDGVFGDGWHLLALAPPPTATRAMNTPPPPRLSTLSRASTRATKSLTPTRRSKTQGIPAHRRHRHR